MAIDGVRSHERIKIRILRSKKKTFEIDFRTKKKTQFFFILISSKNV